MRTPLEQFFFVMSGTASTLLVVVLLGLLVTMVMAWRTVLGARRRVDALLTELSPILAHATAASASVRRTAEVVSEDIALVSARVRETAVRINTMVEVAGVAIGGIAGAVKGFRALKRIPRVRKK